MRKGNSSVSSYLKSLCLLAFLILTGCGGGSSDGGNNPPKDTNNAPTVEISGSTNVVERESIELQTVAADSDGNISSTEWTVPADSFDIISGQGSPTLTIRAKSISIDIDVQIGVKVTDDDGATASTNTTISVKRIFDTLSIQGKVIDGPIPQALVTATIGTEEFSTTSDDQGTYQLLLEVDEDNYSQLVKLSAKGNPATHSSLLFASQLPSFSSIKSLTSGNNELDAGDLFGLNITNVTTAEYALLLLANGSQPIQTEELLAQYLTEMDQLQKLELAALIKLIIDNPNFDLPQDKVDTIEFSIDQAAVNLFKQSVISTDSDLISETMEQITLDANLYDPQQVTDDFDNDGVSNQLDAFPFDSTESVDSDIDGIGDNADLDDDNDGVVDTEDVFPLDPSESMDTDLDGVGNNTDTDDDNDQVLDEADAFPLDGNESIDTDMDGVGNNADTDDDNDQVLDEVDAFPLDENESVDTDMDGVGNNADTDDDEDGVEDSEDGFPLISIGNLTDTDDDGIPDDCDAACQALGMVADEDDDGNGIPDIDEQPNELSVTITSPSSLLTVGVATVTIEGIVSPSDANLVLNGIEINSVEGAFTGDVSLQEGNNVIEVRASKNGFVQTDSITVALDATPPSITVDSHTDGQTLFNDNIIITGLINDVVRGTVGTERASVSVNGVEATVSNRSYAAPITLAEGTNTVTIVGADQVGNVKTKILTLHYEKIVGKKIAIQSGQSQSAQINNELTEQLAVKVTDESDQPIQDATVVFRVVQGDGQLLDANSANKRALIYKTDADGIAQSSFRVGSRVGELNQKVTASVVGINANVVFTASTIGSDASIISVNTGNNQRGTVGQRLPQPMVVYVTDDGGNPIEGASVTFQVVAGGGHFSDEETLLTVLSGSDGFASAEYWLGNLLGGDAQRIKAVLTSDDASTELSSEFTATAYVPADAGNTKLSGLVLNTEGNPLEGATVFIEGTSRQTQTNADGYFMITETPVGSVHLLVDGSTITNVSGEFPTLSFSPILIAGIENTLPQPVYMVQLSETNQAFVSETQDAVVTVEEFPGYKLEIAANSATFPDGSKQGIVSISPVNTNRVPMAPPNGMQPQLAVTIQPSGTLFDPPAKITLPNLDGLPPGKQVDMYSFDHDLNEFVSIGLGTVNEDGSLVEANPGVGILKAGWFITPQPPSGEGDVEGDPDADPNDPDAPIPETCDPWDLICQARQFLDNVKDKAEDFIDDAQQCIEEGVCEFGDDSDQDYTESVGDDAEEAPTEDTERQEDVEAINDEEKDPRDFEEAPENREPETQDGENLGADPIVMATGELYFSNTDLEIPGRGFNFVLKRSYRSRSNFDGRLGFNWVFNYDQRLIIFDTNGKALELPNDSNGLTLYRSMPDGRQYEYKSNNDGSYTSPNSIFDVLRKNQDGSYTVRQPDGFKINFNASGQMVSQVDRFGNVMDFTYDNDGRLSSVLDTLGREIVFSYRADSGHIDSVTDFMGRTIRYYYDENSDLIAVRSPIVSDTPNNNNYTNGKFTFYTYSQGFDEEDPTLKSANHNLLTVTDALGYEYLVNVYENDPDSYEFDRIVRQQYGTEQQYFLLNYQKLNVDTENPDANTPVNLTSMTDRNGNVYEYTHNHGGLLLEEKLYTNRDINPSDPDVFITTQTYNEDGLLLTKTLPEGTSVTYTYDSGNVLRYMQRNLLTATTTPGARGATQQNLVESFSYEPIYTLMKSSTNRRGFTKNYTFDYQHQGNLALLATELFMTEAEVTALLADNNVVLSGGVSGQIVGNIVREDKPTATLANGNEQAVFINRSFNRYGQLTEEVDAEGIVTTIDYFPESDPDGDGINTDSDRNLSTSTGGYKKSVTRDTRITTRRIREASPVNISTSYKYDVVGNIIEQTDGRGNSTTIIRNALNQVVRKIDPEPFEYLTDYYYDANNNLVRVSQQNIGTTGADLSGWVHTVYAYNSLNDKVSEITIPQEDVYLKTSYEYDKNQNLIAIQQPEGNRVERIYDERDKVYQSTRGAGSDIASTVTMHYDGNGNLKTSIDAVDNDDDGEPEKTTFVYDGYDRVVRSTDPLGNYSTFDYDANNNRLFERNFGSSGIEGINNKILLSETIFKYDELDRLYQRDDSLLVNGIAQNVVTGLTPGDNIATTVNMFDANSLVTSVTDDNGNTTSYSYDGVNRQITTSDALSNVTTTTYDSNGNVLQLTVTQRSEEGLVADKTITSTAIYDELNRKVSETNELGNTSEWRYDSRNNVVLHTDPLGNVTLTLYDGLNRVTESREYLSVSGTGDAGLDTTNPTNTDGLISTYYGYDGNSRLVFLADDKGNATTYTFDALNRKTTTTYADDTLVSVVYDADDNAINVTDQNGSVFTHDYDGLNRLKTSSLVPAEGVVGSTLWTYTYDGLSRRMSASDNNDPSITSDDAVVSYRYNSFNHILSETSNHMTSYATYDGLGVRQTLTYGNGRVLNYAFDNIYNLKAISEDDNNIVEYDYAHNRVLERRYQNGTKLSYIEDAVDSGYDGINRALQHKHSAANDELIAGFEYAYDKANNRRYEIDQFTQLADVYEYDSAYRVVRTAYDVAANDATLQAVTNNANTNVSVAPIIASQDESYLLDGVGNWVSVQTLVGSDSDAVGYQTNEMNEYSRVGAADQSHDDTGNLTSDGNRNYFYDAKNRLVKVATLGGNTVATYKYDAFGRRTVKRAGTDTIRYVYFGKQVLEERNGFAQLQRQYVYGNGVDEVLQLRNAANQDNFYHDNSVGSIAAISDSTGSVVERYRYSAYGETTVLSADGQTTLAASSVGNSYGYTGRRLDNETGFYYYRARYYSPLQGRFVQRDPLGYADGMGLYGYVGNNPVNYTDALGLEREASNVPIPQKKPEVYGPPAPEVYGPPAPEVYGPPAPEVYGPPAPEVYGPPAPEVYGPPAPEVYGPPAPNNNSGSKNTANNNCQFGLNQGCSPYGPINKEGPKGTFDYQNRTYKEKYYGNQPKTNPNHPHSPQSIEKAKIRSKIDRLNNRLSVAQLAIDVGIELGKATGIDKPLGATAVYIYGKTKGMSDEEIEQIIAEGLE